MEILNDWKFWAIFYLISSVTFSQRLLELCYLGYWTVTYFFFKIMSFVFWYQGNADLIK